MAENGWLSRKRKRPTDNGTGNNGLKNSPAISGNKGPSSAATSNDNNASLPSPSPPSASASTSAIIPASLMPHLGWTKLSACHRPRAKKRRKNDDWDRDEALQKVTGRAVFFIHDPRPDGGSSDGDESKIWFQGRFFPNAGAGLARNNRRNSPTSVSSERASTAQLSQSFHSTNTNNYNTSNSWGLLAVQNAIMDECLTCSEGGYRELDLTFLRPKKSTYSLSSKTSKSKSKKEKKVRWVAQDVVWTGGNMMALTSDPYSPSLLSINEPGAKFEPQKLMEGKPAMEVANKYFPSMVKRLRIQNVMMTNNNNNNSDNELEDNIETTLLKDAMVLIGDMEVVAPVSFVRMGRMAYRGNSSDDDGLWDD